ncbi:MAG: cbb3-type cytochrome c oxidase subunit 3 [Acidobacteria bacterium]|nr:cbb3-type cytochrome c oxidase subunit 3 [Acidobacteriota bacterium]
MSLSDVVSGAGLHSWSELGLIVSFITFLALLVWLFVIRRGPSFEEESRLPLEDDRIALPTENYAAHDVPANSEEVEDK